MFVKTLCRDAIYDSAPNVELMDTVDQHEVTNVLANTCYGHNWFQLVDLEVAVEVS